MNQILNILEDTLERDGLTRTATWSYNQPLYNKNLQFDIPNYSLPITSSPLIDMLEIRLMLNHLLPKFSRSYVQKIFDVDKIIINQIRYTQQDLNGNYLNEAFRKFFFNNIMILDFASDSFYFTKNLKKLSETNRLPLEARKLALDLHSKHLKLKPEKYSKFKDKKIDEFWTKILASDKSLLGFEARVHEQGINAYGDIILPFTKQIRNNKDDVYDVAKINSAWMKLNRVEEKPTVAYLSINSSALRSSSIVGAIIDYINKVICDILVIKVKNLHLTDGSRHTKPREFFAAILKAISLKKKIDENVLTVCLECGEHLYPLAIQAFDIVSCSANLFDMEVPSGGTVKEGYGGKALDEETLGLLDYNDWSKAFNRIGHFPCSHELCRSRITSMDKSKYTQWEWYVDLRIHNILTINKWMQMIAESVKNQMADLAIDRLRNSPLRILTELITRNYDDPTGYLP